MEEKVRSGPVGSGDGFANPFLIGIEAAAGRGRVIHKVGSMEIQDVYLRRRISFRASGLSHPSSFF
jgi:hypothetical protein